MPFTARPWPWAGATAPPPKVWRDQVVALLEENDTPGYIPTVEEIQDLVEKVLIENGHARVAKAYILYRDERSRSAGTRQAAPPRPSENIPWAKIWQVLDWAVDHGLHTIAGFNAAHGARRVPADHRRVRACLQGGRGKRRRADPAAARAAADGDHRRAFLLRQNHHHHQDRAAPETREDEAGHPQRGQLLLRPGVHPKDEFGDYDFETPQALDLELINDASAAA